MNTRDSLGGILDSFQALALRSDDSVSESSPIKENSLEKLEALNESVEAANETVVLTSLNNSLEQPEKKIQCNTFNEATKKMTDLTEELNKVHQDNNELKLQLNAAQKAGACLELEIKQKEEIIIKAEAELLNNEEINKQEIKELQVLLKENDNMLKGDVVQNLQDQLKQMKLQEAELVEMLNQRNENDLKYQELMEKYEISYTSHVEQMQKIKEENDTVKQHLANLELAFSDLLNKYEKTKQILAQLKDNEEILKESLQAAHQSNTDYERKYELLKNHAKVQLEKSNKELLALKNNEESEITKLNACIKKYQIKINSLETELNQKTRECDQLSALCDEFTGKKV